MGVEDFAEDQLARQRAAGLARQLRVITGPQDTWVTVSGRRALLLCSNNYLGLANHPALRAAAAQAADEYGTGAGASRLISGSMALHHELEHELARLKGTESALLFTSGYHANIGTITALAGAEDAIFSDALNHASIIDGCRLSPARTLVYRHNDAGHLGDLLRSSGTARRRLIITESIFSMDGDIAPVHSICELAQRYGAMVMVDEAHATGTVGAHGGGLVEAEGLQEQVTVQIGTLGKALGSFGAFVAARRSIVDLLINTARSFIYTTALPPAVLGASLAAVAMVRNEPERRVALAANAARLRQSLQRLGLQIGNTASHIIPVHIGDAQRTMRISERLLAHDEHAGVFVQGIRPPTVPHGTARLRVTLMSPHTAEDLAFASDAFQRAFAEED